jgi:hypothetical protein
MHEFHREGRIGIAYVSACTTHLICQSGLPEWNENVISMMAIKFC